MNGVAKRFWSEVHDIRAPLAEDIRRPRTSRGKRRVVKKVRVRQTERAA